MAIIPHEFLNAVVALGVNLSENEKHWIGTGFIVRRKETDTPEISTLYIVTNKHVINGKQQILVRFNSLGDDLVKDYLVNLVDKFGNNLYSVHPDPNSDIATFQICPQTLIEDKSIWGAFDLEENTLTLQQMQDTDVEEGSLIYTLGFPMNLVDNIKTPICRLGCVSRVTDAFVLKDRNPVFLVDAQSFPGNSGGPVISRPEYLSLQGTPNNMSCSLIGILSSYISYSDTLVSQQTKRPIMIREENSGLTIVHPVDRIKEVVDVEWNRINQLQSIGESISQDKADENTY